MKSFVELTHLLCIIRNKEKRWTHYSCEPLDNTAQICLRKGNRVIHIKQQFPFSQNKRTISFRFLDGDALNNAMNEDCSIIGQCLSLHKNWEPNLIAN